MDLSGDSLFYKTNEVLLLLFSSAFTLLNLIFNEFLSVLDCYSTSLSPIIRACLL